MSSGVNTIQNQGSLVSPEDCVVEKFLAALELPISNIRLSHYKPETGTDLDMIINYFWNIELSKALYPSLQALEISLRNAIHTAATRHYGNNPLWFEVPGVVLDQQVEKIAEAKASLDDLNDPDIADDIVARLMFGFWVSLLNKPFELPLPPAAPNQLAWHDPQSRPTKLFYDTFPHAPNRAQSRKKISERCNRILWLRNRVMHYEPVWKYGSLPKRHSEILETLGWISPEMRNAIALCDNFLDVHAGGRAIIAAKLKTHLGIT